MSSPRRTRSGTPVPNYQLSDSDDDLYDAYNSAEGSFSIEFTGNQTTPFPEAAGDLHSAHQHPDVTDTLEEVAARVATMTNYDEQTGNDAAGAMADACRSLKGYEFAENDLEFYFNQIELQMQTNSVKKNWTKFLVLTSILPPRVRDQVKPLLSKQETDFSSADPVQQPYKVLKDKIISIFKPSQETDFGRAMGRVLSGKPSELARQLVDDLCDHELQGCCCKKTVVGMWKRQLPLGVRQAIATIEFNAQNFDTIVKQADDVFNSSRGAGGGPSVSALSGAVSLPAPAVFDEAFRDDLPIDSQVAALGYGRGRGGGRGRGQWRGGGRGQRRGGGQGGNRGTGRSQGQGGQGQGQGGQSHPRHKTQRHADQSPFQSCFRHWTFGKSAHFCMEPGTCPWKDTWVPKSNQ